MFTLCLVIITFIHMHKKFIFYILSLALTVWFSQTTYSVDEDAGPAQPTLVLSSPSSTNITVEITSGGGSATGEYCSIFINY